MWRSLGAALAALILVACDGGGPKFRNVDMTGADYAKGFALTDHTGKARTLADFSGKVVVVFFGYTRCPDVCPTTMVEMKEVLRKLGADAGKVQVLFVTLDRNAIPGRSLRSTCRLSILASSACTATVRRR